MFAGLLWLTIIDMFGMVIFGINYPRDMWNFWNCTITKMHSGNFSQIAPPNVWLLVTILIHLFLQERTFIIEKETKLSKNLNLVISINLFHLDVIDDIFFERNVSGITSDVTEDKKKKWRKTEEESFTEIAQRQMKLQPALVKKKKKYVQNKQISNIQTKGSQAVVL